MTDYTHNPERILVDILGDPIGVLTNPLVVSGADGGGGEPLVVSGYTELIQASFTRPANTTDYAAKDAVSDSESSPTVLTFTNAVRANGVSGYITKARLVTDQSTCTAQFRLHLFNVAPTAINDNAAFTLLWANRASRIGVVDLPNCTTEGTGSDAANAQNTTIRLAFDTAAASRNLYGLLEVMGAFTPASGQNFLIEVGVEGN